MNKFTKKVLTSITSLSVLATMMPTVSFAANNDSLSKAPSTFNETKVTENVSLKTIKDNNQERIVQSTDDNLISTARFDKKTNQLDVMIKNIKENTTSHQTIDLESSKNSRKFKSGVQSMQPLKLISSQSNLLGGFAFYYYTNDIWLIQIPEQAAKNVKENDNNTKELNGFRTSLYNLDKAETAYTGKVVGETAVVALGLLETPNPWTVVLGLITAAGLAAWMIPDLRNIYNEQQQCIFYFNRVKP
ncbi:MULTISPECIES: geobacillin-26 family protein [Bacillus cereus group]|nr:MULTISPECIES: geobacillin-26 family protein [Bacillus cereus group]MCP1399568.1 hypothetical protein [Bacillus cereus]OBW85300.1 hypothetical protein A9L49_27880 [Bacillus cereus]PER49750.1 hypothetical protein CN486_29035 [Bacillus thuringiensis]PES49899.1 hypothetical protein CN499_13555 [Bacillus thuringiensis]PEV59681.1 hypothetical protein CN434_30730 [Bacillus thuringiensis]